MVGGAAIAPRFAWRKLQRALRRPFDDLLGTADFLGKRGNRLARTLVLDQAPDAGSMGENVTHGHATPSLWQPAQVVSDFVVEPEFAVFGEQHDPTGNKRFGDRKSTRLNSSHTVI